MDVKGELSSTAQGMKMLFTILSVFFHVHCRICLELRSIDNKSLFCFCFLAHKRMLDYHLLFGKGACAPSPKEQLDACGLGIANFDK